MLKVSIFYLSISKTFDIINIIRTKKKEILLENIEIENTR